MEYNKIYCGDCLDLMKQIPDGAIDMILVDPPYNKTRNSWDSIIPLDQMWKEYLRITKDNACIAIFADGLFMADLMVSQRKIWRYNLIWDKVLTSGFLNANKMPLRQHEEICIFYKKLPVYNPQKIEGGVLNHSKGTFKKAKNNNYGDFEPVDNAAELGTMKHPTSILRFQKPHPSVAQHPTEKSVKLCEWLINTYTNSGDLILDNCSGSGTSCLAAVKTNRNYIGMDIEQKYCAVAEKRINDYLNSEENK